MVLRRTGECTHEHSEDWQCFTLNELIGIVISLCVMNQTAADGFISDQLRSSHWLKCDWRQTHKCACVCVFYPEMGKDLCQPSCSWWRCGSSLSATPGWGTSQTACLQHSTYTSEHWIHNEASTLTKLHLKYKRPLLQECLFKDNLPVG